MENTNPRPVYGSLAIDGTQAAFIDMPAMFGDAYRRLPIVLRLLLENVLRNMQGEERDAAVAALFAWTTTGSSQAEIAFQPGRVLMHDTTSTPALVDIAAMRDALREAGADPHLLNPGLPVDVSVDHSLAVEAFARPDAAYINLGFEMRRNAERYRFLRWASSALSNVRINPPGTGIMHTLNMEQLATVVKHDPQANGPTVYPDMMLGTDSHTPMINGLGVLGWGVGGLEAQTVMFGMPTMLRIPDVCGVRLAGALRPGVTATDLALTITQRLRALDVAGDFVEFFGPGVATLSAGTRCVVANMAPEYGATTGYFPIDNATLTYLRETGRSAAHIALVDAYARRVGIALDPDATPVYSRTLDIDLGAIDMHVAGPKRPQDLLPFGATRATLRALNVTPRGASNAMLPRHAIAIAAITSCTNTSDPRLLVMAGLVARRARELGMTVPAWVKTSLAPGSPAAARYLERAGLLDDLSAVGFDIVGYGCTTCIGNSGGLPAVIQAAMAAGTVHPVAVLSGNRNFTGRIHPDLDLGFLMSPPLVVAFALAGDAERDLSEEPVGLSATGDAVYVRDLWPTDEAIDHALAASAEPADYREAFRIASESPAWRQLDAPNTPCFPWDDTSTALRRPPFASRDEGSQLGIYTAYPLLIVGDDITTDHISPASAIPSDSLVADFLVARGDDRHDLNVFASRRGNWEVMMRAAFHSKSLKNLLCPAAPVAHTLHVPSGEIQPIWEVADRYRREGNAVVLVAGARYGTGSSRDWAAKGQRLLGIRAVLATSFERIHRSNLIGMGILPLQFAEGVGPETLRLAPGDRIEVQAEAAHIAPRAAVAAFVHRRNGTRTPVSVTAAVETQLEVALLRAGGVIPAILERTLAAQHPAAPEVSR
ncbi:aconitate hydratase AcnA [Schauerella aestuarii]|uniref:aconitate hydratase AcnA n=1 Tax=Schauerella aestuarii TaxID=2511204 RepID=UPI00136D6EB0|nr:aconitate hydratase AcnA [Achromobacter aestuarii]MYZ43619.1 aconitate hydratase AcnA [Achromobacter aestuarii]